MSFTGEAELGALFINTKTAISMHQMLAELGHPQPRTPMQTNNTTAHKLLTNNIWLPKALKAMDMHFHWLRCHSAQGHFLLLETRHIGFGRLLHQPSPNQPPQICPPHNTNSHQRSQIHKMLLDNNNNSNIWTTNQNIGIHKMVCQESTTNTKVQDHDHQHSHSKKCLKILMARVC